MAIKPQDILVLLKLLVIGGEAWSYASLANQLSMSSSQVHASVQRLLAARLAFRSGERIVPDIRNLEEFLVHGLKYVFVAQRGELTRGMPTAHAAPPLNQQIVPDAEPPPVWPDAHGSVRGMAFSPLFKQAPKAALADSELYELLALVDAIRGGRARERELAIQELNQRMERYAKRQ